MLSVQLPHFHGALSQSLALHMPETEEFSTVSFLFKQLSDPSRIRIFWLLCHCEECGINIASMVGMTGPAVSHHLRLLKDAGLIISHRDGKEVYYRAADNEQAKHLHLMIEKMVEISCPKDEMPSEAVYMDNAEIIESVHDFITENYSERFTIEDLSHRFNINTSTLKEEFKNKYGKPIASYMKDYRMEEAKELLLSTTDSILFIAQSVGYETQGKFSSAFKEYTGLLPTEFRKQG